MTKFEEDLTHFGYQKVESNKKVDLVAEVFHSVAPKYDFMNDLMSFGLHRLWKKFALAHTGLRKGQKTLDVASGTGDLARILAKQVGENGLVVMTDINEAMLAQGRNIMIDQGYLKNIVYVQTNAEQLPFSSDYFDAVTIAFGLRNVTHQAEALAEMYRVLKPGNKLLILEFSHPTSTILKSLYDLYSFYVIPTMGRLVTQDRGSYQYLVESIRMHPHQEKLKSMMESVGFEEVQYINLHGGIVALHMGLKY